MVGYALSAASESGYENMLITVIDADDFTFAYDGVDSAVYKYSRERQIAERVDADEAYVQTPYGVIYAVASLLRKKETEHRFPMALSWTCPEFGEPEIVNEEFQKMWPAVMFLKENPGTEFLNITEAFFDSGIRPLHASFCCDVLNTLMYSMGVYISDGFCPCFNSVFCDLRILKAEKVLFGSGMLCRVADEKGVLSLKLPEVKRFKVSRRHAVRTIEKHMISGVDVIETGNMRTMLIMLKKQCVKNCMNAAYECLKKRIDTNAMYELMRTYISDALNEIVSVRDILSVKCIADKQADIYYMSFDELLSALTFADERMDLKSAVRVTRQKYSIARKAAVPYAVMADGRLVHENI